MAGGKQTKSTSNKYDLCTAYKPVQFRVVKTLTTSKPHPTLDVAKALTYLHQIQPDAVIHQDISSANVLLEQLPLSKWRAKVTDYGSVNIVRQLNTQNPGSPVYSAPEASNPSLQSPKMDIFSFGALVLEMLTNCLPARDDRPELLHKVFHEQLLYMIESV